MIHFITVHWGSSFWIEPQLKFIAANTDEPYKIYSYYTNINRDFFLNNFAFAEETAITDHATKLNRLADIVCENAKDDELIVFIDSDAFPIAPWVGFVRDALKKYDLVAVRRDENVGDIQPHPCFCVTTAGLWRAINGDWREGYKWKNSEGQYVTDVGGNLLRLLDVNNKTWLPITRSNKINLHSLWFGIYGDIVYHHGAGSRDMLSRVDAREVEFDLERKSRIYAFFRAVGGIYFQKKMRKHGIRARVKRNLAASRRVESLLLKDTDFHRIFSGEKR